VNELTDAMAALQRDVAAWDGVRAEEGRFDSVVFRVGRREIGHVHRDGVADLPFPRSLREQVLDAGQAGPHRAGVAGFVSAPVRRADQVAGVVALFRLNYERAVASAPPGAASSAAATAATAPSLAEPEASMLGPKIAGSNAEVIVEFRANGGKVAAPYPDPPPMLLLHTRGSRSGREHVVPMRGVPDGDGFVVFASAHGSPRHPDWFHNLLAHPEIAVEVGRETVRMRATEIVGSARDALFAAQAARFPVFADYEQRMERRIPVVRLDPIER
jgi:deazaflavin-dependent oxidoreductase (nitroreductase family)